LRDKLGEFEIFCFGPRAFLRFEWGEARDMVNREICANSVCVCGRYTNVGEYRGSWLDWQKRGGPGTKTPPEPQGKGEPTKPVTEMKPTARTGTSGEEDLGPDGKPDYPPGGIMGTRQ